MVELQGMGGFRPHPRVWHISKGPGLLGLTYAFSLAFTTDENIIKSYRAWVWQISKGPGLLGLTYAFSLAFTNIFKSSQIFVMSNSKSTVYFSLEQGTRQNHLLSQY